MNNVKEKKSPQRMCIACRVKSDKKALLRVVRSPEGEVSIDESGKKSGRGAYVCGSEQCLRKCEKGILQKHLQCDVPPEVFEEIRRRFAKA